MSSGAQHLDRLVAGARADRLLHVEHLPARVARLAEWPDSVEPAVLAALLAAGMERPWSHQRTAIDLASAGRHVVLATGTASGKSLGYLVPVMSAVVRGGPADRAVVGGSRGPMGPRDSGASGGAATRWRGSRRW